MEGETSRTPAVDQNAQRIVELTAELEQQNERTRQLNEMIERLRQQNERVNGPLNGAPERFMKYNPPEFDGDADPKVAENWIRTVERAFNCARVPDADRVHCAVYLLRDDASF